MPLHAIVREINFERLGDNMGLSSKKSKNETMMIDVLKEANEPLNLAEIVQLIHKKDASILSGKTPEKSLYSTIYRREKMRKSLELQPKFIITKRGGAQYYSINKKGN